MKFIRLLYLLYLKWVEKGCPHICLLCQFKNICFKDINNLIKELEIYTTIEQ